MGAPSRRTRRVLTRLSIFAVLTVSVGLIAALVHAGLRSDDRGRGEAELVGTGATVFRTGTLDVSGKKATAGARLAAALDQISKRELDIVGFQGLRAGQHDAFKSRVTTRWATYPAAISSTAGGRTGLSTAIAWRTSTWILVNGAIASVTDNNGGIARRPYVLLQHRGTGTQLYVVNADLPVDTASRVKALQTGVRAGQHAPLLRPPCAARPAG